MVMKQINLLKILSGLRHSYQKNLEESVKGSNLFFDHVAGLHGKRLKISFNCNGEYIDSPD